jgi:hypothetical protein
VCPSFTASGQAAVFEKRNPSRKKEQIIHFWKSAKRKRKVFSIFGRVQKGKGRFFQILEECKKEK